MEVWSPEKTRDEFITARTTGLFATEHIQARREEQPFISLLLVIQTDKEKQ